MLRAVSVRLLQHYPKHWVLLHQSQIFSNERYEKLIDKPTEGVFGISGVTQPADAIRAKIDEPDHTWTLLANSNDVKFVGWSFRQADGVDWEKRQRHF